MKIGGIDVVDFIEKVPSFGKSFICLDDKNNNEIIKKIKIKNFYTYGTNIKSQFRIKNINQSKDFSKFNMSSKVAYGYDIHLDLILRQLVTTMVYFFVLVLAGYFILTSREIAA